MTWKQGVLCLIFVWFLITLCISVAFAESASSDDIEMSAEWLVNFTATPTEGYAPVCVKFTADGPIGDYAWDFGDGTTSTVRDPVHCYKEQGSYYVTLKYYVGDIEGEIEKADYIVVNDPDLYVDFRADPSRGKAPLTVQFKTMGNPDYFIWDFGDGSGETRAINPIHQYVVSDNYTPTLTYYLAGNSKKIERFNYIEVLPLDEVSIFPERPSGVAPLCTMFNVNGTADDYRWDFGDNSTTSHDKNPVHCYSAAGVYLVNMTYSIDGAYYCNYTAVNVSPRVLPDFNASPRFGSAPLCAEFTSMNTPSSYDWEWTFGDNSHGSGNHTFHCYNTPGSYDVEMSYCQNDWCGEVNKTGFVTVDPIIISIQKIDSATYRFNAISGQALKYIWNFGDEVTSESVSPVHAYEDAGTYDVSVSITSNCGCLASNKTQLTVKPRTSLDFTGTPLTGCVPYYVQFTESTPEIPVSREWNFGDGTTSTEKNPFHEYQLAGQYTVTLNCTFPESIENVTKKNYVTVYQVPNAYFTAYPLSGYAPLSVSFSDETQDRALRRYWDLGDGSYSTSKTLVHTYTDPGDYNVTLTEWGDGDCSGTKSMTIHVLSEESVTYNLSGKPTRGVVPLCTSFKVSGYPQQWNVSFGDGQISAPEEKNPFHCYQTPALYSPGLHACAAGECEDVERADFVVAYSPQYLNMTLYSGWNLVSIPLTLKPGNDTAKILTSVDTGGHSVFTWNSGALDWKKMNSDDRLDPQNAFWIYAKKQINLPLVYADDNPEGNLTRILSKGWNLVSYPGVMAITPDEVFESVNASWTYAIGFDAINQRYQDPVIHSESSKSLGMQMDPRQGYWLYMNTSGLLVNKGL